MFVLPFFTALILTAALTLAAVRFFPRLGLLDNPVKYGLSRAPIPYFGGLSIFAGFVLTTVIFADFSQQILAVLAGASLICLVSFLDDVYDLPASVRLLAQIFAAGILVAGGLGIREISNPLGEGVIDLTVFDWRLPLSFGEYHFFLLADLLTIFWVVLLVNSLNWQDGVAGQASGVGFFGAVTLLILSLQADHFFDQTSVITLAAVLAGGLMAFFYFNFPPPKILLGDTGSMLIGFVLAALSILAGGKLATTALVLGLPLLDAVIVILRRILRGKSPLSGDYSHFHHTLLTAGFSQQKTVLTILSTSACLGGVALVLPTTFWKIFGFCVIFCGIVGFDFYLRKRS